MLQDRTDQLDRMKAISDGVFSIAMTILVFNIKIPTAPKDQVKLFWEEVAQQIPSLIGFIISFLILGVMWIAHCRFVRHIRLVDRTILLRNHIFLLFVALVPVPSGILGAYPRLPGSYLLYSGIMVLMGMSQFFLWQTVLKKGFQTENTTPLLARYLSTRSLTVPIAFSVGFISALFTEYSMYAPLLIIPTMKIIERRFAKLADEEALEGKVIEPAID